MYAVLVPKIHLLLHNIQYLGLTASGPTCYFRDLPALTETLILTIKFNID